MFDYRIQSHGQQLCKLLGIKESFNMWKEFNSHRIFLYTNMAADSLFAHKYGRQFIVFYTYIAAVTSGEISIVSYANMQCL